VIIRHLVDGNGRVAGDGYLYFTVGFPGRAAALSEPRSSTHTHPNTVTSLHSPHSMPLDDGQRVPIITHPKPSLHLKPPPSTTSLHPSLENLHFHPVLLQEGVSLMWCHSLEVETRSAPRHVLHCLQSLHQHALHLQNLPKRPKTKIS
jgi:hypothetical protein